MGKLGKSELAVIGLMMFSIFFGAGNLIFPPALGQAAGEHLVPAILGFLLTGVGLPLVGIVAIALQGGRYRDFIAENIHPWFATGLLSILYLTIGPLFAVPRTGAVSFEIGIRPFLSGENEAHVRLLYTALFYLATYYLALNPSKLIDRVGKLLTPTLLAFLAVLFAKSFAAPMGGILPATGNYVESPFAQGFQDGYLTMDLLASVAIGTLVVNSVRLRGVEERRALGKVCILSGMIAISLMSLVYVSLSYLGATSAGVLGHSENGGELLADAVGIFFGSAGNYLLSVIIGLACLTTSCGMTSGCADFFQRTLGHRVSYSRLLLLFTLFSFVASNVGLTALINISVPFLVAIYPIVIILVVLSLFDGIIGWRKEVYRYAIYVALVFSLLDGLKAAGVTFSWLDQALGEFVPFYDIMLGWFLPVLLSIAVAWPMAAFRRHRETGDSSHVQMQMEEEQ